MGENNGGDKEGGGRRAGGEQQGRRREIITVRYKDGVGFFWFFLLSLENIKKICLHPFESTTYSAAAAAAGSALLLCSSLHFSYSFEFTLFSANVVLRFTE